MLTPDTTPRVFIVLGATDMRKATNGLSIMVADHLELDVFAGSFFVFCNRGRSIIKILYWNNNGFCLWQKRLEKHRFVWPQSREEVLEMDYRKLRWLLDGLDPDQVSGHPPLAYKNII
jgi:transposase